MISTWEFPEGGVKEADSTDQELDLLFSKLPQELSQHIYRLFPAAKLKQLNEIYLQLGQRPECIFADPQNGGHITRVEILDRPCTHAEIEIFASFFERHDEQNKLMVLSKRRGISGTLHRVAVITKPSSNPMQVLGVTVRVGRAMQGLLQTMAGGLQFLRPLAQHRRSLLLIGKPGVGKTTALREIASILAEDPSLRVVVVDKTMEIAGDGDTPHPAIGKARWMPVGVPKMQHEIMLEAVENQSPDVIIVDEISNDVEVRAAQTIAQRGVMLIATVHGSTLVELVHDRERSALVGGCASVTLSDFEAERRSDKKKQVLKRSKEPVFQTVLELQSQTSWVYHDSVASVIDKYLDSQESSAVLLEPGRASKITCLPTHDGKLIYCDRCHPGRFRCPEHNFSSEQNNSSQQQDGPATGHPFGILANPVPENATSNGIKNQRKRKPVRTQHR